MPSFKSVAAALALALALGSGPALALQELRLGSTSALRGEGVEIPLSYLGDGSAAGLQLDVTFDPAVLGTPGVAAGTGLGGRVLRSAVISSGRLRLVVYSPANSPVGNGELARLSFTVDGEAPLGPSPVRLAGVVLGSAAATAIAPTALVDGAVVVLAGPEEGAFRFHTLVPCRLVDTRGPNGPSGGPALQPSSQRTFALSGACGVPAGAKALSVNVTVTQPTGFGNLRLFPAGQAAPLVSTINFGPDQTRANNAIVVLDAAGAITVQTDSLGTVHFILDVNGYFQ